jgi:hypothetical protein
MFRAGQRQGLGIEKRNDWSNENGIVLDHRPRDGRTNRLSAPGMTGAMLTMIILDDLRQYEALESDSLCQHTELGEGYSK